MSYIIIFFHEVNTIKQYVVFYSTLNMGIVCSKDSRLYSLQSVFFFLEQKITKSVVWLFAHLLLEDVYTKSTMDI